MNGRAILAFVRLGRPLFLGGGFVLYALGAAIAAATGHAIDWQRYALGQGAVTFIIVMSVFFPVLYNLLTGIRVIQPVLVEAILQIGRTLGLCTVAEGIEHPAQQERLLELGCERGQGYYFAAPAPADEVAAFLRARHTA